MDVPRESKKINSCIAASRSLASDERISHKKTFDVSPHADDRQVSRSNTWIAELWPHRMIQKMVLQIPHRTRSKKPRSTPPQVAQFNVV